MQETTRDAPLIVLPCVGGRLELYRDRIRVRHPGWVVFVENDCCFPLHAVRSVKVETVNTYLGMLRFQIETREGREIREVMFETKYEQTAWEVKNVVDEVISDHDVLALIREQFSVIQIT